MENRRYLRGKIRGKKIKKSFQTQLLLHREKQKFIGYVYGDMI